MKERSKSSSFACESYELSFLGVTVPRPSDLN